MNDDKTASEKVYIITGVSGGLPAGSTGVVEHSGVRQCVVDRTIEQLRDDWRRITSQLNAMLAASADALDNYPMKAIKITLGFDVSGKLAFVADAKVSGSIEVTLERAERQVPLPH